MSLRARAYDAVLRGVFFQFTPERIHHYLSQGLEVLDRLPGLPRATRALFGVSDPVLSQTLWGVTFPNPVGLAAGFDKNATLASSWQHLGFGFAELGTITAKPQPGNPAPRLFRLPADHAILNRMGFNNDGAQAVAARLEGVSAGIPLGINIGKSKVTPAAQALEDYRVSARALERFATYLVVNVSSPNTPGLRDLQAVESLRPILQAVRAETSRPVFVKIAPDLADADIDAVADLAVEVGLAGIVATNTTISREGLTTPTSEVAALGAGGISGLPVAARSLDVLQRLARRVGDQLVIISVGGIESPEQAWERITHGAHLVQGYTGFIYRGPDWTRDINRYIARRCREEGFASVAAAVGSAL